VSPYFQVLALFKSFQKKGASYSNQTRVANHLSVLSNTTSITNKLIKFINLLRDDCHKQVVLISESRGDSNRCTRCRENPINMSHAFHALFAYGLGPYISRGPRRNLSLVPTRTKQTPTFGRSLSDRRQTGLAIVLGHLIPSPSR
jgi:hypothetical protein